eukprot:TRINITY_DN3568_c0_g1_i3.p1 TRINITY_DN3568_c0_g1~~TRINITY_DN3568_c0_g1_i3.p1  ORF type:complete len:553 (-),score=96.36 TRINITY_DN3568_c0_g1_i3:423-2024(-)
MLRSLVTVYHPRRGSANPSLSVLRSLTQRLVAKATSNNLPIASFSSWKCPEGHDTGIKVYNSITNGLTPLVLPRTERFVTWYTCGPTVYDHAHVGHARNYVSIDILQRILRSYFRYDVVHVMGMTDVDDKIIARAKEKQQSNGNPLSLARHFELEFERDMRDLNIVRPIATTRVTEHIDNIVSYIEQIIQNGFAYVANGSVYFDTHAFVSKERHSIYPSLFPNPAKFMAQLNEQPDPNNAEEDNSEKRHAQDFALWKKQKVGEEGYCWQSPWGRGRPGWHIECSAMSHSLFGNQLDIHAGGIDLKFPHHCNEIAQCEAHQTGPQTQWPNYFLHIGHLHISGLKMSKSLKNFITISEFLKEHSASSLRWFCLMFRYRSYVDYTNDSMNAATALEARFREFFLNLNNALLRREKRLKGDSENGTSAMSKWQDAELHLYSRLRTTTKEVDDALRNDFDTFGAINSLLNLTSATNGYITRGETASLAPDLLHSVKDYVGFVLNSFGVNSLDEKATREDDTEISGQFKNVMNSLTDFR